jgi:hypothetical protein
MNKKLILEKDLPSCPKGRVFKEDINGNFFHSMTDDEYIESDLKFYRFTREEVDKNQDWFSILENKKSQK